MIPLGTRKKMGQDIWDGIALNSLPPENLKQKWQIRSYLVNQQGREDPAAQELFSIKMKRHMYKL